MRKQHKLIYHVFLFVLAQITWLVFLGLWIYWYVSNYIIIKKVGNELSSRIIPEGTSTATLITGISLLLVIMVIMTLIFIYLFRQINLNRQYNNFIANITHELKSPLASIRLSLETMNKHDIPAQKEAEFRSMMLMDVDRLNNLIDAILEVRSLEQRQSNYRFRVYNAEPLLRDIIAASIKQFNLKQDMVTLSGTAPCRFVCDKDALGIVLNNLMDNAIKYSPERPAIHIEMQCVQDKLVIFFQDQGIGIAAREKKLVFEKFYRGNSRDMPNVKGSGLGLYRVQEIMHLHGGTVSLASEGVGQGTKFKLILPIYEKSKKHLINRLLRRTQKKEALYDG